MLVKNIKENLKKIAGRCLLTLALAIFFIAPNIALAQAIVDTPVGFEDTVGLENTVITNEDSGIVLDTNTDLRIFIARVINVILGLLGIVLLSLIIYGGWVYMTSEGDSDKVSRAKAILRNAAIGLLIILASWGITTFILNALFDGNGGGATTNPGGYDVGVSALGDGLIQSHYPERGQQDVARNTTIIITFKDEISLASICGAEDAASGCNLDQTAIKIFETVGGRELSDDVSAPAFGAGATVSTNDNKTFIFKPKAYLGSATQNQWYGVRLDGDVLKKENGDNVSLNMISSNFYQWKFEVSTRLDLTPPKVESVFPKADNAQDTRSAVTGATKAKGSIEVTAVPNIYKEKTITVSGVGAKLVEGSEYQCFYKGDVVFKRAASGSGSNDALVMTSDVFNVGFLTSAAIINGNLANIGCGISLDVSDVANGSSITINVAPEQQADVLTIGGERYVFGEDIKIESNDTLLQIATKIKEAIITNSQISNITCAEGSGTYCTVATLSLSARTSGKAGNSIRLSSTNDETIKVSGLTGGEDEKENIEINGEKDEPRNAIIQINFNEAMNPLQLQGESADVEDYIKVINKSDNNSVIGGEFVISNNYKTVEFRSKDLCGENMCGEAKYCLPANSNIEVWVKAASLYSCADENSCSTEAGGFGRYGICTGGICTDGTNNNPQANTELDGAMDVAFNSLDGNSNSKAEGPAKDNYSWSFWISDKIDNESPIISSAAQGGKNLVGATGAQVIGASTSTPLTISFNKLMMSSSLKPGRNYPNDFYITTNPDDQIHKEYLVFAKFTGIPLGYWVKAENIAEGDNDTKTNAIIEHTIFADDAAYGFVAGSGIKDIYQNCYNPAADETNCKNLTAGQSCCKGQAVNVDVMCYDFE